MCANEKYTEKCSKCKKKINFFSTEHVLKLSDTGQRPSTCTCAFERNEKKKGRNLD